MIAKGEYVRPDAEPRRRLHFVGTMPQFGTAAEAFSWQVSQLGDRVRRLSGGETGPRLSWFVPLVKELKNDPKIRAVREGDWTDYDDVDRLAVRRGYELRPEDIPLRLAAWAQEELAVLDAAGTPATAERPLQIGVPSPLDLALFILGPAGALRHVSVFLKAVAAQIERIVAVGGDRVVLQLETPAALIAVSSAPTPLRRAVAELMGRLTLQQVTRAPHGTRLGLHLCLGDMGHKARVRMRNADPLVRLANVLARRWPSGRTLEYLHLPLCGGEQPPSTDPDFHAPLRRLRIPASVELVAGIAHEKQGRDDQLAVRALVEAATGRRVDIATACGLGRRSAAEADEAVARMLLLLE
ncbi:hypothetical protein ACIP2X_10615 [Streptomyces sp. NPDC089424]|uniref:hypothetical protein n=1 Tax=Streptomyces sp. NPDC089424 TaxID=3365917 RepID=UPI00382A89FB